MGETLGQNFPEFDDFIGGRHYVLMNTYERRGRFQAEFRIQNQEFRIWKRIGPEITQHGIISGAPRFLPYRDGRWPTRASQDPMAIGYAKPVTFPRMTAIDLR